MRLIRNKPLASVPLVPHASDLPQGTATGPMAAASAIPVPRSGPSGISIGSAPGPSSAAPAAAAAANRHNRLLTDLPRGHAALVVDLAVDMGLRHRLQALGLRPGQRVQVLRRAWWAGPIHLRVGMTELMLRRRDAARVSIQLLDGAS